MCGLCAVFDLNIKFPKDTIKLMSDEISHRGPDDSQETYIDLKNKKILQDSEANPDTNWHVALAFKRLAIQELSELGRQPMVSSSGRSIILYNGELFNRDFFVKHLLRHGHALKGTSDTEVLVETIELFGVKFLLDNIDAMFAFVLIDVQQRVAYASRDHAGIKPLYVGTAGDQITFASEIKAILKNPKVSNNISTKSVIEFLSYNEIAGADTLFESIKKLLPGYLYTIDLSNPSSVSIHESRWYELPNFIKQKATNDFTAFGNFTKEAVRRNLISDVPISCQLSGGVDSSVICHVIKSITGHIDTHSISVDSDEWDEKKYIIQASHNLRETPNIYKMNVSYVKNLFLAASYLLDHPISHLNTLGIYCLGQNAKTKTKVLLSGEGADEILAGYNRMARAMYGNESLNRQIRGTKLSKYLRLSALGTHTEFDLNYINKFANQAHIAKLKINFDQEITYALEKRKVIFREHSKNNLLESILNYEYNYYLPSLLNRQDKMMMAHSIENRVPYLSRQYISDVRNNLSTSSLLKKTNYFENINWELNTKLPLKSLCNQVFGQKFTYRKKIGFGIPERELYQEILNDKVYLERMSDTASKYALIFDSLLNGSDISHKQLSIPVLGILSYLSIFN